jgi:mRNA interferase RelE/StbE
VGHEVWVTLRASKQIQALDRSSQEVVVSRIKQLADDPRPRGCTKLEGNHKPPVYRVRQGNFRILYEVNDEDLQVRVLAVRPRKDAYKGL